MNFSKTFKSLDDQISLLKQRGMIIKDEKNARAYLSNISYYRLSAYFLSLQKYGDPNHTFMPWATFERATKLYGFDKELRLIILDAIERIEVAIRCRISCEYTSRFGNNWYEDPDLYWQGFNGTMNKLKSELQRSKEAFILHYKDKYTNPINPPSWMTLEVLSFGQISIMFKNLRINDAKKAVANHFGMNYLVLESWLEHLTYLRNLCAHHCRLWNRTLTVKATIPTNLTHRWITVNPSKQDKVYTSLCVIGYLNNRIIPKSSFIGKLKTLLRRIPEVNIKAAGFPKEWDKDIFWEKIPISLS